MILSSRPTFFLISSQGKARCIIILISQLQVESMNLYLEIVQSTQNIDKISDSSSQNSQSSEIRQQKSIITPRLKWYAKKQYTNKCQYNWNKREHRKYINFLVKRRELFDLSREEKKCLKINLTMSKAITTRTAAQCHSHHQKMIIKFGSINNTISAHIHLITKSCVPKKNLELLQEIQNYKRSLLQQPQPAQESSESIKDCSQPYWLEFVNADGFNSYSAYPEDPSSQFFS